MSSSQSLASVCPEEDTPIDAACAVRVVARVRPLNAKEAGTSVCAEAECGRVVFRDSSPQPAADRGTAFAFDRVFGPASTQAGPRHPLRARLRLLNGGLISPDGQLQLTGNT